MNPQQRRQLIEKREAGTLTDDEYRQYLDLLRNDSAFYEEVNLRRLLTDTFQQDTDRQRWTAVSQARTEAQSAAKRALWYDTLRRYPYAMAACVALLLAGIWLMWRVTSPDAQPQLVRTDAKEVFAVEQQPRSGKAYSETAMPIGTLPLRWIEDRRQTGPLRYVYCRDTLTLFVADRRDTVRLRGSRLLFDARTRRLLLSRSGSSPQLLSTCRPEPEPIP